MSILQALQDFLEGYEGMELRPLGEILTDLTRAAPPLTPWPLRAVERTPRMCW